MTVRDPKRVPRLEEEGRGPGGAVMEGRGPKASLRMRDFYWEGPSRGKGLELGAGEEQGADGRAQGAEDWEYDWRQG